MGCFEDYMDFREEVDRIKMKDRVKEKEKCQCPADSKNPVTQEPNTTI